MNILLSINKYVDETPYDSSFFKIASCLPVLDKIMHLWKRYLLLEKIGDTNSLDDARIRYMKVSHLSRYSDQCLVYSLMGNLLITLIFPELILFSMASACFTLIIVLIDSNRHRRAMEEFYGF